MNIAENLARTAFHFPTRTAVIDGERRVSFVQIDQDANRMASALAKTGVKPGDHVALCAPNAYEWLVFYFAAIKTGAVAVTFSHLLLKEELAKILADCRPKILFTVDEKLADIETIRAAHGPELLVSENGDVSFSRLAEKGMEGFSLVDRSRHDTAAILYTGGTTGVPKGAMLSHENLQTSIFNVARNERSTENDRALCFLPLNHVFAQVHIMNATFFSAGSLVMQSGFDLDNALEAIERHQVTKFYGAPTIYIRLLELPDIASKLKSVRYCFSAAASMATAVVEAWKEMTGLNIHEAYGMTESASMVTFNHFYRHVVGSVGTPVNLVEVQMRDLEGNRLPRGEKGEICIQGPNMTKGYLNNPEETESAFWGDWFRSGDIGLMDDNGYLYIVDRLKDMIITGGENVYAREVEEVLYSRPEVLECAVIGLPDPEYGERVTAFIVPPKGHEIDPVALKKALKERLAGYKVPKEFIPVDDLPKNNAGKLLKRVLREQYQQGDG